MFGSVIQEFTASVAKKPIDSEPIHPPTKCTPTTSSESSKPSLYFRLTASAQTTPPTSREDRRQRRDEATGRGDRDQAGDGTGGAPTRVGLPSRIHSTMIQPSSAAAVATCVLTNATAAVLSRSAPSRR
jgi:hypothetical protein